MNEQEFTEKLLEISEAEKNLKKENAILQIQKMRNELQIAFLKKRETLAREKLELDLRISKNEEVDAALKKRDAAREEARKPGNSLQKMGRKINFKIRKTIYERKLKNYEKRFENKRI